MMEAGYELDGLVAEKIFGRTNVVVFPHSGVRWRDDRGLYWWSSGYSTDFAAAARVLAEMREGGWYFYCDSSTGDPWRATFHEFKDFADEGATGIATGDTLPLVICLAALKALGCDLVAETKKEAPGETAAPPDRGAQGSYC